MLAPLRDHLPPKDPRSSPLLCTTKEHYFRRLSIDIYPGKPGYDEAQWIASEDVNVEHLLNVFTSIDANSDKVWTACHHFMEHLTWHKRRLVVLGPKVKQLPDNYPSKAKCLFQLARLFEEVGNYAESKQLFIHTLKLGREQGDDLGVAETLWSISNTNRMLGLNKEGIQQAKEALELFERFSDVPGQARSLCHLAYSLYDDGQFNAAEGAASQVINRFSGRGEQYEVCECLRILGETCHSQGKTEKAIERFQAALEIASSFNWHHQLLWIHYSLANLSFDKGRFDDAHAYIEHAKSLAINDALRLSRMVERQALFWYRQRKFEEARSAVSYAADVYERLGATKDVEDCRNLLRRIEQATKGRGWPLWIGFQR
jgi:tetratricopeptide (TPR) repeat protein